MLKNHLADMSTKLHEHHPHKDFAKYDFFQILSIVYVLLLPRLWHASTKSTTVAGSYSWSTWAQANSA